MDFNSTMIKLHIKTYLKAKDKTNKPFNEKTQPDHNNPGLESTIILYGVDRDDYTKRGKFMEALVHKD